MDTPGHRGADRTTDSGREYPAGNLTVDDFPAAKARQLFRAMNRARNERDELAEQLAEVTAERNALRAEIVDLTDDTDRW